MSTTLSKDGTSIAFSAQGRGPALILVDGAMCCRAFGPLPALAQVLAAHFTVYTYDRRGRGESSDTEPYAVLRETEDLQAVAASAGGRVFAFGMSSGAVVVLNAASGNPGMEGLAFYDPPFMTGTAGPAPDVEYGRRLAALLAQGRRGDAVELFLTTIGTPSAAIAGMRKAPFWPLMESMAPTLAYDHALLADSTLLSQQLSRTTIPALVMAGADSPDALRRAAQSAAEAIPHARLKILEGQSHNVSPEALAAVVAEFLL